MRVALTISTVLITIFGVASGVYKIAGGEADLRIFAHLGMGQEAASSSPSVGSFLQRADRLTDTAVRDFARRAGGTPLVEGDEAIFLVEASGPAVPRIVGDFNNWGQSWPAGSRLSRLGDTRFFVERVRLHRAARVEYRVNVDGVEGLDPLNPRTVEAFEGRNSEVRMPGYVPPEVAPTQSPRARGGRVVTLDHKDASTNASRRVHVYLPAGYDAEPTRRYPVAWFNDGSFYVERVGLISILDQLIERGRIEPLIAVMVDPVSRRVDYGGSPAFRAVVADELVPIVDGRFRTDARASRRLIAGGSRGGMAAIDLALAKPSVFGMCAAWAPAIAPMLVKDFLSRHEAAGGRFNLIRSLYDERFGTDATALRDGLESRGATVTYTEAPEGHTLGAWPARVIEALITLLPGR